MGEMYIRKLTPQDEIWVCDDCKQTGVRANGQDITDTSGEVVMWFCYTCAERLRA